MISQWPHAVVSDLVESGALRVEDGNHGEYRPRPDEFTSNGVAFVRAADLRDGQIDFARVGHVNAVAMARIRKGIGAPGDVLLTHKGTVGRVAIASEDSPDFVCSPQTTFWRVINESMLDRRYLRFFLESPAFQSQLGVHKDSSDMAPYVSLTDQRALRLTLPPLGTQRAIAGALSALDEKIISNTRLKMTAESLSATMFRSITGEGCDESPLSELARFINGRAYTKDATGTGRVVIRIAELNSGIGESTVHNNIEVPDDNVARPGDLLFAWSGSLTVHRWFRPEAIVNQHIFKVIPAGENPIWLIHRLLARKLADFRAIAADKATTMGHIQRRHLDEPVSVPSPQVIERLHPIMDSLWLTALSAEQESLSLASLRDTLLPHLMSGRLRVKDAEKQVEAVV